MPDAPWDLILKCVVSTMSDVTSWQMRADIFSFFFPFCGDKGHQGSSMARGKRRGNVATLNRVVTVTSSHQRAYGYDCIVCDSNFIVAPECPHRYCFPPVLASSFLPCRHFSGKGEFLKTWTCLIVTLFWSWFYTMRMLVNYLSPMSLPTTIAQERGGVWTLRELESKIPRVFFCAKGHTLLIWLFEVWLYISLITCYINQYRDWSPATRASSQRTWGAPACLIPTPHTHTYAYIRCQPCIFFFLWQPYLG